MPSLSSPSSLFLFLYVFWTLLVGVYSCLPCPQSLLISDIPDIVACNATEHNISFTFPSNVSSSLAECKPDRYSIHIFHHELCHAIELDQSPPPDHDDDTNLCCTHVTLPRLTFEDYNDKLFQVWIVVSGGVECSNNFTAIIGVDPPGPVNESSIITAINCSGVYMCWSPPFTPPGCDILNYTLQLGDMVINTEGPFYNWSASDLSPNEIFTVSITAVNGNGASNETFANFTTAIAAEVNVVNYSVIIQSSEAHLVITAEVDSTCAFSYPILLHICTICENNMSDNSCSFFNVTFNDDGVILNETLPIDLLHCSSNLTWSNLHSSYVSHIYNFSTSPVYSVFIPNTSSTGYFRVDCTLLPGGRGCVIKVFNSTGSFIFNDFLILNDISIVNNYTLQTVSNTTTHQLSNGTYNIYIYSLIGNSSTDDTVIASRMIEVILPPPSSLPQTSSLSTPLSSMLPTLSPSLPSPSTPSHTSLSPSPKSNIVGVIAGSVSGVLVAIVCIIIIMIVIVYCKIKRNHQNYRVAGVRNLTNPNVTPQLAGAFPLNPTNYKRPTENVTPNPTDSTRMLLGSASASASAPAGGEVEGSVEPKPKSKPEHEYQQEAELSIADNEGQQAVVPTIKTLNENERKEVELETEGHETREDLPKTQPETVTEGGDDEVTNIDVTVNGADK